MIRPLLPRKFPCIPGMLIASKILVSVQKKKVILLRAITDLGVISLVWFCGTFDVFLEQLLMLLEKSLRLDQESRISRPVTKL